MNAAERYPRYRVPAKNGQVICVPPWSEAAALCSANQAQRSSQVAEIQGRPLAELAKEARRSVVDEALAYTRSYTDVDESEAISAPLILSGHQPGLVHPGVWLKEFAASQLAKQSTGTAISLIVDSDLCRAPSIRVPTGTVTEPRVETVAYDQTIEQMPLEERLIVDLETWATFGARTTEVISPLVEKPLVASWWPQKPEIADLGLAIAQARHLLERTWGNRTLNVPQSRVCQTEAFRWFAAHLFANAERFRTVHNSALAEYRRVHRIRNGVQPIPDLAKIEGLIEAPFWLWTIDKPRRQPVYVKFRRGALVVTDRDRFEGVLPLSPDGQPSSAIEKLAEWESQGTKIRTRALTTTMFSRLILADLFIHGIGGAKYDQVTDAICADFFGLSLPPYVTISGTLRLPIEHLPISPTRVQDVGQQLRELTYHPETRIPELKLAPLERSQVEAIAAKKSAGVQITKTPANARERHRQIVTANQALQLWIEPLRTKLRQDLSQAQQQLRANLLLESREYPFCLFPGEDLRNFLLDFSQQMG